MRHLNHAIMSRVVVHSPFVSNLGNNNFATCSCNCSVTLLMKKCSLLLATIPPFVLLRGPETYWLLPLHARGLCPLLSTKIIIAASLRSASTFLFSTAERRLAAIIIFVDIK